MLPFLSPRLFKHLCLFKSVGGFKPPLFKGGLGGISMFLYNLYTSNTQLSNGGFSTPIREGVNLRKVSFNSGI